MIRQYCFVNFVVNTFAPVSDMYISGSTKNLGLWNASKAVRLTSTDGYKFTIRKRFKIGESVEFKVLTLRDWRGVEKGMFAEEIANHHIIADKGAVAEVTVYNWRRD